MYLLDSLSTKDKSSVPNVSVIQRCYTIEFSKAISPLGHLALVFIITTTCLEQVRIFVKLVAFGNSGGEAEILLPWSAHVILKHATHTQEVGVVDQFSIMNCRTSSLQPLLAPFAPLPTCTPHYHNTLPNDDN